MYSDERRQQILELLKTKKFINVPELARQFFISEATIRRDLERLKNSGLLKRTYGGAALIEGLDSEIPLALREEERSDQKDAIAKAASNLIKEGGIIIVDSSSTSAKLIPYLHVRAPKAVITNSPKIAIQLSKNESIHVYSTGGFLRAASLSYVGEAARAMISSFYVDILFFSCRGASLSLGLTDPSEEEAELKRTMIKHAKTKVVLLDSQKINNNSFACICGFDQIDYLVTETELSEEWVRHLEEQNVRVIYPQ